METFTTLFNSKRVELGLLIIDIVGHSKLQGADKTLKEVKDKFKRLVEGIVTSRGGKLFNWAGDGGSFMFLVDNNGFNDLAFSALQMLNSLPAINEEIAIYTGFSDTLSVRISCDSGVVVYDVDPSLIHGDVINKFFKNERNIGLTNSVSITDRVWKQLLPRLKEKFKTFKESKEVNSLLYNFGGKEKQTEILQSLQNIDQSERPYEIPECVEIIAFKGDTLEKLSQYAYEDVVVKGYDNIAGLNLLISKNAQWCLLHEEENRDQNYEKEHSLDRGPYENRLLEFDSNEQRRPYEPNPTQEFNGGERLRFYNCAALGYAPLILNGTLLDNVFAGHLKITRVIGGVPEPVIKKRTFRMVNRVYIEIEDNNTDSNIEK